MEAFRRARIALALRYCLLSAGTLLVVSVLVVVALWKLELRFLDRQLLRQARWLEQAVSGPPARTRLDPELAEVFLAAPQPMGALVYPPGRQAPYRYGIAVSRRPGSSEPHLPVSARPVTYALSDGSRARLVTAYPRAIRGIRVVLLASLAGLEDRREDLVDCLVVGNALAALLAALLGWHLAGKALEPIRRSYLGLQESLADASHELRTPLTAIVGEAEVALRKERSAQEYQENLANCASYAREMMRAVENLLELSRADAGAVLLTAEPVDFGAVVEREVEAVRRAHGEGPRITCETPEGITLLGDEKLLAAVVRNLLENAVAWTRREGQVRVALSRAAGRREVLLRVADDGEGIAPEHVPYIFERFYQVDKARSRAQGGSGLGLSIVKSAVDAYGGSVAVESHLGEGSVFTVRLPHAG